MTVCATAKRRRKQARMGFTHIAKRRRPHFSKGAGNAGHSQKATGHQGEGRK